MKPWNDTSIHPTRQTRHSLHLGYRQLIHQWSPNRPKTTRRENEQSRWRPIPSSRTCYFFLVRAPIISAERAGGFRETDGENSFGGKWWIIKRFHFLALRRARASVTRRRRRRRMTFPNKITDPSIPFFDASHFSVLFKRTIRFYTRILIRNWTQIRINSFRKIRKFVAREMNEANIHPMIVAHRGLLSARSLSI